LNGTCRNSAELLGPALGKVNDLHHVACLAHWEFIVSGVGTL
jgi:hypothetical protein